MRQALDRGTITLEELREKGSVRVEVPSPHLPYRSGARLKTASGRIEIESETFERLGLDRIPSYVPPHESEERSPELARRFPLALISPPAHAFLNSTFVNVASLRRSAGKPTLEIHADDAGRRGITAGDTHRSGAAGSGGGAVGLVGEAHRGPSQRQSHHFTGRHRCRRRRHVLRQPRGRAIGYTASRMIYAFTLGFMAIVWLAIVLLNEKIHLLSADRFPNPIVKWLAYAWLLLFLLILGALVTGAALNPARAGDLAKAPFYIWRR
jgi:hypothetical protein